MTWDELSVGAKCIHNGEEFVKLDRVFAKSSRGVLEAFGRFQEIEVPKEEPKKRQRDLL